MSSEVNAQAGLGDHSHPPNRGQAEPLTRAAEPQALALASLRIVQNEN